MTGEPVQDIKSRTAGTVPVHTGQDTQEKTYRTGEPGQDVQDSVQDCVRTRQSGQDRRDRLSETG
jgi:hypothetical protein